MARKPEPEKTSAEQFKDKNERDNIYREDKAHERSGSRDQDLRNNPAISKDAADKLEATREVENGKSEAEMDKKGKAGRDAPAAQESKAQDDRSKWKDIADKYGPSSGREEGKTKEIEKESRGEAKGNEATKDEPQKEGGMEHSFETGMAEGGGIFDQLTDQIGQSIVEKLTSKDQGKEQGQDKSQDQQSKGQDDRSQWKDIADKYSPPSGREEGKTKEKEQEQEMER